jgi:RNA polymerase sigma-70 factor (ECF subfamily)
MTHPVSGKVYSQANWKDAGEDEDGLVRAARDDPSAFACLYDRHMQALFKYLLSKTGDVAEAEDLASQAFLSAYEKLSTYRHQGTFRAWLFCIARNKLIDHYRKNKHNVGMREDRSPGIEPDYLHGVIQDEKIRLISRMVDTLGEAERDLIRLRLIAGLEFQEIAAFVDKSEAAVKKSYYRLIERMKQDMEQRYE